MVNYDNLKISFNVNALYEEIVKGISQSVSTHDEAMYNED
ncbi:hypothetical protein EHF_0883 [Ehrlichia japonica]|uniref:Uncharacterized protein n=1 Tax=Ehrlichia japonica TaxID=391036 RepID=X5GD22_9RICK|nr:hypothetical protein EHF_0883 [Ehrlichia japonica]